MTAEDDAKIREGLEMMIDALKQWPNDSDLWAVTSNLLLMQGRDAEALKAADRAICLRPTEARFWASAAPALEAMGCWRAAAMTWYMVYLLDHERYFVGCLSRWRALSQRDFFFR